MATYSSTTRIAIVACLALALIGCQTSATKKKEAPVGYDNAAGTEPVEGTAPLPADETSPLQAPDAPGDNSVVSGQESDKGSLFVGTLIRNDSRSDSHPSDYCLEDGQLYQGATYRLGRINLFGLEDSDAMVGLLVSVRAERRTSLADVIVAAGPCEGPSNDFQFRSDWAADEGGFTNTRRALAEQPYLQAIGGLTSADGVLVIENSNPPTRRKRDSTDAAPVTLTVHNPYANAFSGLVLVAHYEGGGGKPMPRYQKVVLDVLPGESVVHEVPGVLVEKQEFGDDVWGFAGAELIGSSDGIVFLPRTSGAAWAAKDDSDSR